MQLLFEFLPILLFWITYKYYGVLQATGVLMIGAIFQLIFAYLVLKKKPSFLQKISVGICILLGAITVFSKNEVFIKWKPTILYTILGTLFFFSHYFQKTPFIKKLLEKNISLPSRVWKILNISWGLFAYSIGIINFLILKNCSTETWVQFKVYWILGLTFFFLLLQGIWLNRYTKKDF